MIKAESEGRIRIKYSFSEGIKVSTGLYERDLGIAIALIATVTMILVILRGERIVGL